MVFAHRRIITGTRLSRLHKETHEPHVPMAARRQIARAANTEARRQSRALQVASRQWSKTALIPEVTALLEKHGWAVENAEADAADWESDDDEEDP